MQISGPRIIEGKPITPAYLLDPLRIEQTTRSLIKDAYHFTVTFHYLLHTMMTQEVNTPFIARDILQALHTSTIC